MKGATPRPGRQAPPSPSTVKLEADERHNRVLLHALQTAHAVMVNGKTGYIHTLKFSQAGGGIEVDVFLTGDPANYGPQEVELAPDIE